MNKSKWVSLVFLLVINMPAYAYTSVDEQIDKYLDILANGSNAIKIKMLERLQWSGLTEPRLYDEVEKQVLEVYVETSLNKQDIKVYSHQIRALGYSGNEKYRATLNLVKKDAGISKFRRHAIKALVYLDKHIAWNQIIKTSEYSVEGKPVEVANYLKMLSTNDIFVQRLAARAIYHEQQRDPDLLLLLGEKLEALYMQVGLDKQAQDTAAWFCKAIGQAGIPEYGSLLSKVASNTPYSKIKKYALQYAK